MSMSKPYKIGRGLCIFINNVVFGERIGDSESFSECRIRLGAGHDTTKITEAIKHLDMKFIYKENLKASDIEKLLNEYRDLVNSKKDAYHSLIVIISSHGDEGIILGTDENPVDVRTKIVKPFHNTMCTGLQGSPKIFIINACR